VGHNTGAMSSQVVPCDAWIWYMHYLLSPFPRCVSSEAYVGVGMLLATSALSMWTQTAFKHAWTRLLKLLLMLWTFR
jgi:hypothetical protein